jgi:hypothetical protein
MEKDGDRPVIYIALKAHATYFRSGNIRVATGEGIPGTQVQYQAVNLGTDIYDMTNRQIKYEYTLIHLRGEREDENSLVETWEGRWGDDETDQVFCDEPHSPLFRGTGTDENDENFIYLLTEPAEFHNAYLKDTQECLRIPSPPECPQ